jgi:hypothetical protein
VPGLDFPNLAEAMGETASSVLDRTWFWKDDLHLGVELDPALEAKLFLWE